jgi:hypothetical protein
MEAVLAFHLLEHGLRQFLRILDHDGLLIRIIQQSKFWVVIALSEVRASSGMQNFLNPFEFEILKY